MGNTNKMTERDDDFVRHKEVERLTTVSGVSPRDN